MSVVKWAPRAMDYFAKHGMRISQDDIRIREEEFAPFYNVAAPRCSEDKGREVWAIGVELLDQDIEMDDQLSWPRIVSLQSIREASEKVEVMLRDLDLPARDIVVFPRMRVSI